MQDKSVAVIRNNILYHIQTDHLNTPRTITNNSQVVWEWENKEPFGANASNYNLSGTQFIFNLRFPGQYYDSEKWTNYNYFRHYAAGLGRYMQSDPIGLAGGINTYGYVGGNSLSASDPLGLSPQDIEKMRNIFNKSVQDMIRNKIRLPGNGSSIFNFNNQIAKACNPNIENKGLFPYLINCKPEHRSIEYCDGQSKYLSNEISKESPYFDDLWKVVSQNSKGHWWLVALSANERDPVVYLDAWAEDFSVGKPCINCTNPTSKLDQRPLPRIK